MGFDLERWIDRLDGARTLADLQEAVVALRDGLGTRHVVYHWVSSDGEQYGCGTYDPLWAARYVDADYVRIDPVVLGCFRRFHPVDWKRLDWSPRAARAFLADAIAHGVGHQGYTVPVRGPGGQFALFTASDDRPDAPWADFIRAQQRALILSAHYLNRKALEIAGARAPESSRALSPRELDALTFLAMGYARGQAAELLGISEHTLRAYIESARFKLGAQNTTHAVARALADGLIVMGGAARGAPGDWPGRDRHPPQAASASAVPRAVAAR